MFSEITQTDNFVKQVAQPSDDGDVAAGIAIQAQLENDRAGLQTAGQS